jgi:hypothetical protein
VPSRPLLIIGNIIAITVTMAAFAQAVSWTIAGILILISLILPLLASIVPPRAQLIPHSASKTPGVNYRPNANTTPQHKSAEKHSSSGHQSIMKIESKSLPKQQAVRPPPLGPGSVSPSISAPQAIPSRTSPPRLPPENQGPNLNPTIAKDDYMEYDVDLEAGKNFLGEVTADGLVNVYLLDEENMDNLDEGEEFWSETGEECVETVNLEFTAPSKGKWFFVIENADDRAITATVKMQKGSASTTQA